MKISLEKVKIFADGLDHVECVAWHPDGSIWAGGEAGQIYRITEDGGAKEIANTGGFILGIAFNARREWLAICDLKKQCIWRLDTSTYDLQLYTKGIQSHEFNIPNYICFDSRDNLYISESGAFREVSGKILKFSSDGEGEIWHPGPFSFSNGMALDKKEKYLYVVCSFLPGVERIAINDDGSAGNREVFVTIPKSVPDGIAFDDDGNLYVSCYAPNTIYQVDQSKTCRVFISDWEAHALCNPTNIAFGGRNFDQLFTSNLGRWHISQIDAGVKGLKLICHE